MLASAARIGLWAVLALIAGTLSAAAQSGRTWVSGLGDDINTCTRVAACKTFAGALSRTGAGGTISVLDPGGYGSVTILKALSIQSDPAFGSLVATGTTGVIVNAGANDDVLINGLIIDGTGSGLIGVRVIGGRSVTLTNCIIRGFGGTPGVAVDVGPNADRVVVTLSNCMLTGNRFGVRANPTGEGRAVVLVDGSLIENNTNGGIVAAGNGVSVMLNSSLIRNNSPGLSTSGNAEIISNGNNVIRENQPNGAPTSTIQLR